jgi:hypothetical protein
LPFKALHPPKGGGPFTHKVFGPFIIQALSDVFLSAKLRDTFFATQAIQHNADLPFAE